MRIERGNRTIYDYGYDKTLSKSLLRETNHGFVLRGDVAGGDLEGLYPRPSVTWANGATDLYDASYVNVTGDMMTGTLNGTDISLTGRIAVGDIYHAYGGFQDATETITIGAQNTWYHITNATNDLWTGIESTAVTLSNDVMTVVNEGDYWGVVSLSISGLLGKDFEIRVFNVTDGVIAGYHIGATTSGAGNYSNVTLPFYLQADANSEFRMEIRCTTNPVGNPTLSHAVFFMGYLHDHIPGPSVSPSVSPSLSPSISPSISPSVSPSVSPSLSPSA